VERVGDDLLVVGCFPKYGEGGHPADLLSAYRSARKATIGNGSPHIRFANADSDDDLIAFVRLFGPVVARSVEINPEPPFNLTALQGMRELRNERSIYRAALSLVMSLSRPRFDYKTAQFLIRELADKLPDWHRQWERERKQYKAEPMWKLSAESLKRIQGLGSAHPDFLLPPQIDARIVVCELLNTFPARAFPNPLELNASIRYGIRPLLYALLTRETFQMHETGVCANVQCRKFFEIKRGAQRFCEPDCSRRQRQREYWMNRGKKLRTKRLRKNQKAPSN